jgi:8-oxo-dGTP diphosphatase
VEIPYTICFCVRDGSVLVLRRKHPPNEGKWNGLGGKIEAGETPAESVPREVFEEAGVDVFECLRYAGVATWNAGAEPTSESRGMHAFIAEAEKEIIAGREAPEGLLAQPPIVWVCDPRNDAVVSNVPRFLPATLDPESPIEFRCEYEGGILVGVSENSPSSRI